MSTLSYPKRGQIQAMRGAGERVQQQPKDDQAGSVREQQGVAVRAEIRLRSQEAEVRQAHEVANHVASNGGRDVAGSLEDVASNVPKDGGVCKLQTKSCEGTAELFLSHDHLFIQMVQVGDSEEERGYEADGEGAGRSPRGVQKQRRKQCWHHQASECYFLGHGGHQ